MKTSKENNESELQSRNAHSISEGPRKWLLYLPNEKDPLIGFVHAATKEEALARMAPFVTGFFNIVILAEVTPHGFSGFGRAGIVFYGRIAAL